MNLNVGTALDITKQLQLRIRKQDPCQHASNISVLAGGIERHICESCGHVSFKFADQGADEIDRDRFARAIDQSGS